MKQATIPKVIPKHLRDPMNAQIKAGGKTVRTTPRALVKEVANIIDAPPSIAMLCTDAVFLALKNLLVRLAEENDAINTEIAIPEFGRFNFLLIPEHEKLVNHLNKVYVIPKRYNLKFTPSRTWLETLNGTRKKKK